VLHNAHPKKAKGDGGGRGKKEAMREEGRLGEEGKEEKEQEQEQEEQEEEEEEGKEEVIREEAMGEEAMGEGAVNKAVSRQPRVYQALFRLCLELLGWADPWYQRRFIAIAVTKNFVGSPHIDSGDISYQYAISLGSFDGGGQLCVESEDHRTVAQVDTHCKLARMDGRFVHWVRRFSGGERYSLIFYMTSGDGNPRERAVHTDFKPMCPE
jgi:hypothetical protein